ncbi:MAG: glycosyltransferase family 4 protein [Candidatus Omnitrophica bacterium]|nr:glycosyltransferase family 4 protein [Candidatus Omnitrophota bacterium]
MKRIIIFNSSAFIYGSEKGLLNLIKALRKNFRITVVLPERGPLEERIRRLSPRIEIKRFPLAIISSSLSPFYYIRFGLLSLIDIVYFTFYIIFKDMDIICTNNLLLVFPGIVARITGKRHMWHVREFSSSRFLNSFLGRFIGRFSHTVICQSDTIKDRLRLDDKAKVIYEPLDESDYKIHASGPIKRELDLPADSKIIALISRIHPSKGQLEFIKGIKDGLKKYEDLFLIIVGDISPFNLKNRLYKRRMKDLINKSGLKNVLLLGFREDIDRMLSLSDICVFPFKREEPFGISVAESLAYGKPTFYPRTGGLKEIYDIFKEGEEPDIAKILERVSGLRGCDSKGTERLRIPERISFLRYSREIIPIFEGEDERA